MTTSGTDKSKNPRHDQGATPRGWTGVAAVTLGTFTLVTNEFIPVGLPNIAEDLPVSLGRGQPLFPAARRISCTTSHGVRPSSNPSAVTSA
jgi:hypothetical protein